MYSLKMKFPFLQVIHQLVKTRYAEKGSQLGPTCALLAARPTVQSPLVIFARTCIQMFVIT